MNAYDHAARSRGRQVAPMQPLRKRKKQRSAARMAARRAAFASFGRQAQRKQQAEA